MNVFSPRQRTAGQRHEDGDRLEVAGSPVRLRVDGRARRVSLRLDAAKREVVATAPSPRRLAEAVAFAHQRAEWIAGLIGGLPVIAAVEPGGSIEVLGMACALEAGPGRARLVRGEGLRLRAPSGDGFKRSVLRVLKAEARRVLTERTQDYARALERPMPVVSIMDAKARWGSCTQPRRSAFGSTETVGRIRYSWRLVLSPYEVMDYVAAHECAHLVEANHGPRFWALVRDLVGDERPHRRWLRAHSARLQAFGV